MPGTLPPSSWIGVCSRPSPSAWRPIPTFGSSRETCWRPIRTRVRCDPGRPRGARRESPRTTSPRPSSCAFLIPRFGSHAWWGRDRPAGSGGADRGAARNRGVRPALSLPSSFVPARASCCGSRPARFSLRPKSTRRSSTWCRGTSPATPVPDEGEFVRIVAADSASAAKRSSTRSRTDWACRSRRSPRCARRAAWTPAHGLKRSGSMRLGALARALGSAVAAGAHPGRRSRTRREG